MRRLLDDLTYLHRRLTAAGWTLDADLLDFGMASWSNPASAIEVPNDAGDASGEDALSVDYLDSGLGPLPASAWNLTLTKAGAATDGRFDEVHFTGLAAAIKHFARPPEPK